MLERNSRENSVRVQVVVMEKSVSVWREGDEIVLFLTQLVLVLLPETVSSREEVPASLLVHLPHIGLLQRGQETPADGHRATATITSS